jgi:mannosylglycerate hydrolase
MTTLHLISHTHWDREWYLTFQQLRLRLVHLIDGLLDRMTDDFEFRYFMLDGQTIVLDDYLQIRPEKEPDLRRLIQEERILIGPWHILPDEFLVSPEATLRNLLQGDRTAKRFGCRMQVGYIPDPFGHIGQMPQILRGFGIDSACLRRGLADEPIELNWQAPDGSTVFLIYLRDGYDNAAGLPTSEPDRFVSEVKRLRDSLAPYSAGRLQVIESNPSALNPIDLQQQQPASLLLMHGTDHMEPPYDTPAAIAYASGRLGGDQLVHSTLPTYMAAIRQELGGEPLLTVIGELRNCKRHNLLPGVLSSRIWIKQRNRTCETLLEAWAEPFTTWSEYIVSRDSSFIIHPSSILLSAWRLLMECHPHDSICGCSIDQVHDEMRVRFDQVEQIGEEITRQSLARLASFADTTITARVLDHLKISSPLSSPSPAVLSSSFFSILVFNPTYRQRSDIVTISFELPPDVFDFEIIDDQGQVVTHQQKDGKSVELIHMSLDRRGLQDTMSMIHDGRAANMVVRDLKWQRQGDIMVVQVIMATSGEPDLDAWRRALHESEKVFADDTIQTYLIQARTPAGSEATFVARDVPSFGYKTYWLRAIPVKTSEIMATKKPNRVTSLLLSLGSRLEKIIGPIVSRTGPGPSTDSITRAGAVQGVGPRSHPGNTEGFPTDYAAGVVTGKKPPYVIENEFLRIEASTEIGTFNLRDKRNGVVYQGLNQFVDGGDCGDEYNFCPPEADRLIHITFVDSVGVESGPIMQLIEIALHMRLPAGLTFNRKARSKKTVIVPIHTRLVLYQGIPRLDIYTTIDHLGTDGKARALDHRLRVHFPAPFAVREADYDGHFEIVHRKLGVPDFDQSWVEYPRPEKPQRLFTAISGDDSGLAIANQGLPEIEVFTNPSGNSELALTLLRCTGWLSRDDLANRRGHAGPALATPGAQMAGRFTFAYSIIPFLNGTSLAEVYAQAAAFNAPLRAQVEPLHPGTLPGICSLIRSEPVEFVLSAIKLCDDGSGWIARGYNLGAAPLQARLVPWMPFAHAERVTLSEQPLSSLDPARDGSVAFPVRGHEIVTIKFY